MGTASRNKTVVAVIKADDWQRAVDRAEEYRRDYVTLNARDPALTTATQRLVVVIEEGVLVALCLGRSLGMSDDLDTRVRYSSIYALEEPVDAKELSTAIKEPRSRKKAEEYLSGGGVLPPATEQALFEALHLLRPETEGGLRTVLSAQQGPRVVDTDKLRSIAEQRDAVALGLEIAGFDSRLALPESSNTDLPFLAGLDDGGTSEAAIIRHDASRFEGWKLIDVTVQDVVSFEDPADPNRKVAVIYTDKEPLEKLTGTDLIYYRTSVPGYVLVQYKRMERVPDKSANERWEYRPDKQLDKDFERMRLWAIESAITSTPDWRLSQEPFYFKLVENDMRRPMGDKLVKGMYFPRTLFELLQESPTIAGPRGGKVIGWHNAGRYLEKDEFVTLLQRGWIGSTNAVTDQITQIVQQALQRKRGVVIVQDESTLGVSGQRRRK